MHEGNTDLLLPEFTTLKVPEMETTLLLFIALLSVSFMAVYLGEGLFKFFANLVGCLVSLALTLLAIATVVVAVVILLRTPL